MTELPETLDKRLRQLDAWVQAGWLRDLDQVFAAFLAREAPDADPLLLLGAALASHQLGRGHVCLDLRAALDQPADTLAIPSEEKETEPRATVLPPSPADLLAGVTLAKWQAALRHPRLVGEGGGDTPLVLSGARLYLRRYWQHEQSVRAAVTQRTAPDAQLAASAADVRPLLDALFASNEQSRIAGEPDWQKISCALALRSHFTVITGGPGTGKTTTVVKLLALLQHLAISGSSQRRLRIRLAAPTGKAAARLNASIASAVEGLALGKLPNAEQVRGAIPTEVSTVHRLLGSMGGSRRFRHDARNPLPVDVLVLDESSMVDLETMAAVLAALPPQARLVLLGDKDQLASVEAGSVLGELCRRADAGHYREATREWLENVTGERIPDPLMDAKGQALDQSVVKLRRSYRFDKGSGIGQLAEAVNAGDFRRVKKIRAEGRADLGWVDLTSGDAALRRLVLEGTAREQMDLLAADAGPVGYRHYLERLARERPAAGTPQEAFDAWAGAVLSAYGQFQLLCAVRKGPYGVERLNQRIALLLHAEGLLPAAQGWYLGRPVMVTRNDYATGLMNGDVGVTLELPAQADAGGVSRPLLRVAFRDSEGGIRWVLPSRLQEVETVFAMTVHKSQGSEFAHTALVLPDRASRVLTRELVYTAVTRARQWFTVAGPLSAGLLEQAVDHPTLRASGLLL